MAFELLSVSLVILSATFALLSVSFAILSVTFKPLSLTSIINLISYKHLQNMTKNPCQYFQFIPDMVRF